MDCQIRKDLSVRVPTIRSGWKIKTRDPSLGPRAGAPTYICGYVQWEQEELPRKNIYPLAGMHHL